MTVNPYHMYFHKIEQHITLLNIHAYMNMWEKHVDALAENEWGFGVSMLEIEAEISVQSSL